MEDKNFKQKRGTRQFLVSLVFFFVLIAGWRYPLLGYFIPLCMLLGLTIGLRRGRKWCDWYCPRGSFYDAWLSKAGLKKQIPGVFRNMHFRIGVLFLLMLVMGYNLFRRWPNPYRIGAFFVIMLTITTVLGVILAVIFHQRSWCLVCPIGTLVNLTGKSKSPLTINSGLCTECKLCAKVCPMQLSPYLYKGQGEQVVKEKDCLRCGLCICACPTKALGYS
jgi:ferredoxin-type protein NapH